MRRVALALLVVPLALGLPGCGRGEGAAGTDGTGGAGGREGRIAELAKLDGVDLVAVLEAGCAAWQRPRDGERRAVNDWVTDLLGSGGRVPVGSDTLDRAVEEACATAAADPHRAVRLVLGRLSLGPAALSDLVAAACQRFRERYRGPDAPEPFDPTVREVLADGGVDEVGIRGGVEAACGPAPPEPAPGYDGVTPDPSLTPGDTAPEEDLAAWCAPAYERTQPPLTDEDRRATLDAYGIPADERASYEVVRLVPLGLGGTNAQRNLFPVSTGDRPGAATKAEVDRRLTEIVCAGRYDLAAARANLVRRWPTALAAAYGPCGPPLPPTTAPSSPLPTSSPTATAGDRPTPTTTTLPAGGERPDCG